METAPDLTTDAPVPAPNKHPLGRIRGAAQHNRFRSAPAESRTVAAASSRTAVEEFLARGGKVQRLPAAPAPTEPTVVQRSQTLTPLL